MSLFQDCISDRRFLVRCLIVSCFVLFLTTVWTLDDKLIIHDKYKADGKSKLQLRHQTNKNLYLKNVKKVSLHVSANWKSTKHSPMLMVVWWGVRIAIFIEIRHLVEELITFLSTSIFGLHMLHVCIGARPKLAELYCVSQKERVQGISGHI